MVKIQRKINLSIIRLGTMFKKNNGVGLNELLGTAAAIIIAAFVVIPGLKSFAGKMLDGLGLWWDDTITGKIFTK
jgi:hypothetical protein